MQLPGHFERLRPRARSRATSRRGGGVEKSLIRGFINGCCGLDAGDFI